MGQYGYNVVALAAGVEVPVADVVAVEVDVEAIGRSHSAVKGLAVPAAAAAAADRWVGG